MTALLNTLIVYPIVNLLLVFLLVFSFFHVPGALGFSIIGLTVFIRLALNPFYKQQMDLSSKMTALKPKIDALQKKYKDDKQKLQQAQLQLYKDEGINPAGGCLVGILQLPFIIGLYNTLNIFLKDGSLTHVVSEVNKIAYSGMLKVTSIDPNFFGFNLATSPSKFQTVGLYYLMIPVLTFYIQYLQGKYTFPTPPKAEKKESDKDKPSEPDMSSMMSSQMKIMFPIMVGYFSYILPVGLAIYWNVFSIFSVLQYIKKNKNELQVVK